MVMQILKSQDFEAFTELPENADKTLELIGGEIVEKMPSNPYCSYVAMLIASPMLGIVKPRDLGYVTGEGGGYGVGEDVYAPNVAFTSKSHQVELAKKGFNRIPPDLAVEVVSPTDSERLLTKKILGYLARGTRVWVVYPADFTVDVYVPGKDPVTFGRDGVLTAPDILPGFELKVSDIFPDLPPAE